MPKLELIVGHISRKLSAMNYKKPKLKLITIRPRKEERRDRVSSK